MKTFRIADTFTDSLTRLTNAEQKAIKTTAFDLQLNPSNPGMRMHKPEKAKDKHFWSVRAGRDLRIIAHKTQSSPRLCRVDRLNTPSSWQKVNLSGKNELISAYRDETGFEQIAEALGIPHPVRPKM